MLNVVLVYSVGIAGAFIDREVETRGVRITTGIDALFRPDYGHIQLDAVDSYKAKRQAEQHINDIPPEDLGY